MLALARIERVMDSVGFRVVVGRELAAALRIGPGAMVKLGGRDGWSGGVVAGVDRDMGAGIAVTRDVAEAVGAGLVALHVIPRVAPAEEVYIRFRGGVAVKGVDLELVAAVLRMHRPPIFPGFRIVSGGLEAVVVEVLPRHPAIPTFLTRFRLA